MRARRTVTAGGVAVVAFGLVAVAVIETVAVDPVAGILGVLAGVVAGLATAVAVMLGDGRLHTGSRTVVESIAVFGYALVAVGAVVYTGVEIDTLVAVAVSGLLALGYGVWSWIGRRRIGS